MKARFRLFVLVALVTAACAGEATDGEPATSRTESPTGTDEGTTTAPPEPTLPPAGFPSGESALEDMTAESFPEPLVPPEEILSGGPPPDGIPPIDDPAFISVEEADAWLSDDEPVVALQIGDDARAYPVQILIWHEIVNDTVGGEPVSVTYCPLCNSAISYVREVDGHETTFGTSGRLYASALVMYDRATESLWTHFDGRAVVGVLTGHRLEPVSSPLLAWSEFKESYPDGQVLDRDATGHSRSYGTNPYTGYDNPDERPFMFRGEIDDRSAAMQRVVGVEAGDAARAWTLEAISGEGPTATNASVGEAPLVILWEPGQSSALQSESVDGGRDVGSVGVFDPNVDGRRLTFTGTDTGFVDEETGSTWTVTGTATAGELEGTELERIPHLDTFWFAWSTYSPGTDLVEP
ncbi:MAG: DUF3179 domain-containing protein [Actinomycetota bacterium]